MKKLGLICVTLLVGLSLSACNNLASQQSKSSKMSSLKAEHSSLIAESRKQAKKNHKNKHNHKQKNANSTTKASNKKDGGTSSSSNNSTKQATQNDSRSSDNGLDTAASSAASSTSSNNNYDATDSYNGDSSRYRNGTRKPSTFSNSQDYQAYLAYYQGYNYDKSTGQMTRMNDQQLNDMRQQMNKDGGQSFGQGGQ